MFRKLVNSIKRGREIRLKLFPITLALTIFFLVFVIATQTADVVLIENDTEYAIPGGAETWYNATVYNNTWLEFDGVDDYVNLSFTSVNTTRPFSYSFWINLNNYKSNAYVLAQNHGNDPDREVAIQIEANGLRIKFYNGSNWASSSASFGSDNIGTWHHFVGSYNGSYSFVYLDSDLKDDNIVPFTPRNNVIDNLMISARLNNADPQDFVDMGFDELRIYNRSLTQSEITEIYSSGRSSNSSLNSTGLEAWYSFNEGSGTTVYDKSGNDNHGV